MHHIIGAPFTLALVAVLSGATADPALAACPERGRADAVVCEINDKRAERGLTALRRDDRLQRAGRAHARDMVRRGYFSHVTPEGTRLSDRLRAVGYVADDVPWRVGETLAWGRGSGSDPVAIVEAWLQSPSHRRLLLRPAYRDIGVGATPGLPSGGGGVTYAAELGVVGG